MPVAKKQGKSISKMAAVRDAVSTLGKKAMPVDIAKYIKDNHQIDMDTKVISTYKFKIAGPMRKKKRKAVAAEKAPQATNGRPASPKSHGLSIEDLHTVKALTNKVGAAELKKAVELFA